MGGGGGVCDGGCLPSVLPLLVFLLTLKEGVDRRKQREELWPRSTFCAIFSLCLWGRQPFQLLSCFIFPSLLAECCRKSISKAWSYLPPRWPAAASGWCGWRGVPPQWLKLFSWPISLAHKQWGWMQEPVDLGCSQRQQQRAFRDTCAQNRALLGCLTSCPCWQWQILTSLRYSWKEQFWETYRSGACATAGNVLILPYTSVNTGLEMLIKLQKIQFAISTWVHLR